MEGWCKGTEEAAVDNGRRKMERSFCGKDDWERPMGSRVGVGWKVGDFQALVRPRVGQGAEEKEAQNRNRQKQGWTYQKRLELQQQEVGDGQMWALTRQKKGWESRRGGVRRSGSTRRRDWV